MKTFETPAGKKIQLKIDQKTSLIKVEFASGGELPMCFTGGFTTEREAEIAVRRYLASMEEKKTSKSRE